MKPVTKDTIQPYPLSSHHISIIYLIIYELFPCFLFHYQMLFFSLLIKIILPVSDSFYIFTIVQQIFNFFFLLLVFLKSVPKNMTPWLKTSTFRLKRNLLLPTWKKTFWRDFLSSDDKTIELRTWKHWQIVAAKHWDQSIMITARFTASGSLWKSDVRKIKLEKLLSVDQRCLKELGLWVET